MGNELSFAILIFQNLEVILMTVKIFQSFYQGIRNNKASRALKKSGEAIDKPNCHKKQIIKEYNILESQTVINPINKEHECVGTL